MIERLVDELAATIIGLSIGQAFDPFGAIFAAIIYGYFYKNFTKISKRFKVVLTCIIVSFTFEIILTNFLPIYENYSPKILFLISRGIATALQLAVLLKFTKYPPVQTSR